MPKDSQLFVDNIAIVVVTFCRFTSFERLMNSIAKIQTNHRNIPLVISIDFHENNARIIEYAENFQWNHGKKEIIKYDVRQGLKNHIISCGNLSEKYDGVLILEDDLYVSPYFYDYAVRVSNHYYKEKCVSGFSLYSYERAESANFYFKPIYDGFDTYFIQFPSSWGQIWLKHHWQEFTEWLDNTEGKFNDQLPDFISVWPKTSWKKLFASFLIQKNKYFVFPKVGFSTNFAEVGQHHPTQLNIRQVELLSNRIEFNFPHFNESNAKYDCGFELEYGELVKLNPELKNLPEFDVDFYCRKNHKQDDLILTVAKSKKSIKSFSGNLVPLINNVILNLPGNDLVITKFIDVDLESVGVYKSTFFSEFKFLSKEIFNLIKSKVFKSK